MYIWKKKPVLMIDKIRLELEVLRRYREKIVVSLQYELYHCLELEGKLELIDKQIERLENILGN